MDKITGKEISVIATGAVVIVLFLLLLPILLKIVFTVLGIVLIVYLIKKIRGV